MTAGKRSYEIDKFRSKIILYNENYSFDCESIKSVIAYDLQSKLDALIVVNTTLYLSDVRSIVRDIVYIVIKNRRELII